MILKFSQFILEKYETESRGQRLDRIDAIEFYKANCSDWNLDSYKIYRGLPYEPNVHTIVKPNEYNRISSNTSNFYTKLIDNLPSWQKYPKRSKSIIGTNALDGALNYTKNDDDVVIVIPSNKSKIGVASYYDFWFSFNKAGIKNMKMFNAAMDYLFNRLNINNVTNDIEYNDLSEQKFKQTINVIGERMKDEKYISDNNISTSFFSNRTYLYGFINSDRQLFDYFNDILCPDNNDFNLINTTQQNLLKEYRGREIWTDGDCLLIKYSEYELFKKAVKEA
jgi:hypothetical protein